MGDGEDTQSDDRVLVRPYIKEQTPADPPRAGATAELPIVEEPAPAPPPPAPETEENDGRRIFWLVGGALVVILALAGAVVAIWPSGDTDAAAPPESAVWPQSSPRPTGTPPQQATSASPATSVSASSVLASRSTSASVTVSAPTTPPPTTPPPSGAGTQAPPAADRTGPITGAGGHCLDVKGGISLIGSPLSVYDCNSTLSQKWTVGTDGTLRNSGGCASADGTEVRVSGCGSGDGGQWRAGSGGTLVNVASGQCLSNPAGGRTGESLQLAACGGAGQQWGLP